MMFPIVAIVLSLVVFGESAFVDTLTKCSKNDEGCQTQLIQNILHNTSKTGIPEFEIPPFDPFVINNKSMSLLDVEISLDGVVRGIRNCVVNKFTHDLEHRVVRIELTCDILIKGKYKVFSNSPLIKNLLGGDNIHGEGDGKLKIEKLHVELTIPFSVKKRGNDIFLLGKRKKLTYSFDVLGKIVFAANNLYVGDKESSADIVRFLNEQSKLLLQHFGKLLFDDAIEYIFSLTYKFFEHTPSKYFIIEDLSSYAS